MSALEKAKLRQISSGRRARTLDETEVQFNPTTLRLRMSNQIAGGRSRGRQRRQYLGTSSSELSMELVFDTADEGKTEKPRSVREKVNFLERFVLPTRAGRRETPPRLQFQWDKLVFEGIVDSLDVDFDLFAANGRPLRAKVRLSIKEQNPALQLVPTDPSSRQDGAAADSGSGAAASGAPGSTSPAPAERTAAALGGETAPEFAARMGLAPEAWRALDVDLSADMTLAAGVEVGFDSELTASAGLGVNAGVEAGADLSLEAAFGLEADAQVAAGFALATGGGPSSALESVSIARAETAAESAREAFAAPAGSSAAALGDGNSGGAGAARKPGRPEQRRPPLGLSGARTPAQQAAAAPAPPPPQADPRSTGYGLGVPLRPRVKVASEERPRILRLGASSEASGAPREAARPTTAPWVRLPARDRGRELADAVEQQRRPRRPCACVGPCKHRGGRP